MNSRRKIKRTPSVTSLPTENEFNPWNCDLDAQHAWKQFGGLDLEHACEKSCACTTCHVIVREGFNSLDPSEDKEDDMLDRAWGLTSQSRLSCQLVLGQDDLTIEIPRYTINQTREGGGH